MSLVNHEGLHQGYLSDNATHIGKGLCAGKGRVIEQDWCWNIYIQGLEFRVSLAKSQSYLLTKLAETAFLLLHVLIHVKQQRKVVGEVKAPKHVNECPSDPFWLIFYCTSHHLVYHLVKMDCRLDTPPLRYDCLDLEVQAATSHAAGEVVLEASDDLNDALGNPISS